MSDEGVQEKETEIAKGGGEETDPGNIIFRPNLHLIGIWGFNFTLGWSDISSRRVNRFFAQISGHQTIMKALNEEEKDEKEM